MRKLVLAAIGLCFSVGVNAACDTKSLKGDYSVVFSGTNGSVMCGAIGIVNFDGKGTAKSSIEVACGGGTPQLSSESGVYLVNGACFGGITFKDARVDFVFDKAFKVGSTLVTGIGSGIVVGTILKQ